MSEPLITLVQPTQQNGRGRDDFEARQPLAFDFDAPAPAPAPRYLVDRLLERGEVFVLSGDTGAAKSIVTTDLVVAGLRERGWLGREVAARRFLIMDEENPERIVVARLRALGMTNADATGSSISIASGRR